MFTPAVRLPGVASFLCAELLDFAAAERRLPAAGGMPACDPRECSGLGHLPALARAVASATGCASAELLRRFGSTLFGTLLRRYPSFFVGVASTTEIVTAFESHLAAEVAKLAPHVRLPAVTMQPGSGRTVEFACRFPDGQDDLADLVEGLLLGSVAHFAEPVTVAVVSRAAAATPVTFRLVPRSRAVAAAGAGGGRRAPS